MPDITLEQQIKAVARETALRQRIYPRRVARGGMTQREADHELAAMQAVLATLRAVAEAHRAAHDGMAVDDLELAHILRICRQARGGGFGVLSTGEKLAAAIVLDRPDWIAGMGYTLVDAIDRLGPRWLRLVLAAARMLEAEQDAV